MLERLRMPKYSVARCRVMRRRRRVRPRGGDKPQPIKAREGGGSPQQLAATNDDAIRPERLDRRYSTRAEKPLKRGQLALAFEHQAYDGALRCKLVHRR